MNQNNAHQLLFPLSADDPRSAKQGQSKATPLKQKALEGFLAAHSSMVCEVQRKYPSAGPYCFIETNAGSGWNESVQVEGSPLIALRALSRRPGLRHECWFIEKDASSAESLRDRIDCCRCEWRRHGVICADHAIALPGLLPLIPRGALGLVYADPNKPSDTPTEAMRTFFASPRTSRIDALVNINAHAVRRIVAGQRKGGNPGNYEDLRGMMRRIGKRYWWIRDTVTSPGSRWTFLYGANYPHIKIRGLGRVGLKLFPVDSEVGAEMLACLMGEDFAMGKS